MATIAHPVERIRTVGWARSTVFTRTWLDALPQDLAVTLLMPVTLLLRLTMGWIFIWSGFDKLFNDFSAAGFLTNATQGPFGGWFQNLGTNQTALDVINPLVVWGQILIGVTLVLAIVGTVVIAYVVKATVGLRVAEEVEVAGLDLAEHGEEGYHQARG